MIAIIIYLALGLLVATVVARVTNKDHKELEEKAWIVIFSVALWPVVVLVAAAAFIAVLAVKYYNFVNRF